MTSRRPPDSQLDLFSGNPTHAPPPVRPRGKAPIEPAPVASQVRALVPHLPPNLRMGTSSWSFSGWTGLIYADPYPTQRLAREGLPAYSQHPLLRTVGVDRTHYATVSSDVLARFAASVPDDFRFLVKAHEACTLARFPGHARYGSHRNQINSRFLDPAYASEAVVAPFVTGLGAKGGPLLFQFAPQPMEMLVGPARFAERLHTFLRALPTGPLYAVEVRNAALLTKAYVEALADVGACHCINLIGGMPDPVAQWNMTRADQGSALIVRWMLPPNLTYEQAEKRYEPFNAIVNPDHRARQSIALLIRRAHELGLPCYVVVNNKAEGSAPLSIMRLAEELARNDDVPF